MPGGAPGDYWFSLPSSLSFSTCHKVKILQPLLTQWTTVLPARHTNTVPILSPPVTCHPQVEHLEAAAKPAQLRLNSGVLLLQTLHLRDLLLAARNPGLRILQLLPQLCLGIPCLLSL